MIDELLAYVKVDLVSLGRVTVERVCQARDLDPGYENAFIRVGHDVPPAPARSLTCEQFLLPTVIDNIPWSAATNSFDLVASVDFAVSMAGCGDEISRL